MPDQFVSWWQRLTGFDKLALGFFVVAILLWAASQQFGRNHLANRDAPKFATVMVLALLALLIMFVATILLGL